MRAANAERVVRFIVAPFEARSTAPLDRANAADAAVRTSAGGKSSGVWSVPQPPQQHVHHAERKPEKTASTGPPTGTASSTSQSLPTRWRAFASGATISTKRTGRRRRSGVTCAPSFERARSRRGERRERRHHRCREQTCVAWAGCTTDRCAAQDCSSAPLRSRDIHSSAPARASGSRVRRTAVAIGHVLALTPCERNQRMEQEQLTRPPKIPVMNRGPARGIHSSARQSFSLRPPRLLARRMRERIGELLQQITDHRCIRPKHGERQSAEKPRARARIRKCNRKARDEPERYECGRDASTDVHVAVGDRADEICGDALLCSRFSAARSERDTRTVACCSSRPNTIALADGLGGRLRRSQGPALPGDLPGRG